MRQTSLIHGGKATTIATVLFAAVWASAVHAQVPAASAAGVPQPSSPALAESKKLYEAHCSFCHGAGPARGGTAALERRLGKDRALLENRQDLDRTYVQYVVRNGLNAMIPFRRTEINDQELSFILDWLGRPHMAAAPAATTAPTGTQP